MGLVFLVGACVGSFVGVVVDRIEKGSSWVRGRSKCNQCGRKLAWWENVPVFSYLFLRGKCRSCHSPIPYWYLLSELGGGAIFLLTYFWWRQAFRIDQGIALIASLLIAAFLLFIFIFDARNQIILDKGVLGLLVLAGFLNGFYGNISWNYFLASFGAAGFLFFLHLVTRGRGMGLGDVKFAFFMGLFLGWPKVGLAFYLAFLTGGLAGAIMILLKKAKLKQKIAFGPFLVGGTLISWWWGGKMILSLSRWLGL